jgi:hypothetical protein
MDNKGGEDAEFDRIYESLTRGGRESVYMRSSSVVGGGRVVKSIRGGGKRLTDSAAPIKSTGGPVAGVSSLSHIVEEEAKESQD